MSACVIVIQGLAQAFHRYVLALSLLLAAVLNNTLVSAEPDNLSIAPPQESDNSPFDAIPTSGVPEGFEDFFEPQTTAVDVFFGGNFIVTSMATYTPNSIEFLSPDEIAEHLNDVLNRDEIMQMLSQPLEPNAELVCYDKDQPDCGSLEPDDLGIIFDEGRFRTDVFIHPSLLAVREAVSQRYLPSATTELSYINNLSAAISGGESGNTFNLQGQTLVSEKQQRVQARWNIDDNDGLAVDEIYWQKDERDFQYQVGWFDTSSRFLDFVGTETLMGVSYATSLKVRTDLDYARGSPLQVFLSSRSLVRLLKDGRILSANFYDAGNQLLDTSALPEGAYDVEIQIRDASGNERAIQRFYSKTPLIPPLDTDLYYAEAGMITNVGRGTRFPDNQNEFTVRGGYSHRLKDNLGVDVAGAYANSELVTEAGLYWINPNYSLQPKALLSFNGDFGLSLYGFGRYKKLSGSYRLRRIWSDNHRDAIDEYHLIKGSTLEHSLSLNYPVYKGQLSFSFSSNQRNDNDTEQVTSLGYDRSLHRGLYSQWDLGTELTVDDSDKLLFVKLSWRRVNNKFTHNAYADVRTEDNAARDTTYLQSGYSGTWDDGETFNHDVQVRLDATADRFRHNLSLEGSVQGGFGRSRLAVDYRADEQGKGSTSYAGGFSTSVAGEGKHIGWGGKQSAQAGLLLGMGGSAYDSAFDVYVNNRLHTKAKVGQTISVPVRAYESYEVKLKDRGTDFIAFDNRPREVTLYPGNVAYFEWNAEALNVLIGRVVRRVPGCLAPLSDDSDECWAPMVRAKLEGAHGWASTDEDGQFQAEIKASAKTLTAVRKDFTCEITLPDVPAEEGMIYLEEDIRCINPNTEPEPQLEPKPEPELKTIIKGGCQGNVIDSTVNPDDRTRVVNIGAGC